MRGEPILPKLGVRPTLRTSLNKTVPETETRCLIIFLRPTRFQQFENMERLCIEGLKSWSSRTVESLTRNNVSVSLVMWIFLKSCKTIRETVS